jgi:hypothetical protein
MQQMEDRTQNARALLLVAGALLGAVGMSQDSPVLIYIAIGLLAVGLVLAATRRIQMRRNEE